MRFYQLAPEVALSFAYRVASAPYVLITSIGSGKLRRLLLIFLPSLIRAQFNQG